MDSVDAVVSLKPSVVIDDNRQRYASERLELSSVKIGGKKARVENGFDVGAGIVKSKSLVVDAESEWFDRDLYAALDVEVRVLDQAPSVFEDGRSGSNQ